MFFRFAEALGGCVGPLRRAVIVIKWFTGVRELDLHGGYILCYNSLSTDGFRLCCK